MSTSTGKGVNALVRRVGTKSAFADATNVVTSGSNWQQGDILAWDPTNKIINSGLALTDVGTNVVGIAFQSVTAGVVNDPYQGLTDVSNQPGALEGPEYGDVYKVIGKSGDTFTPGCYVYPDYSATTSNQVTVTSGSAHAIGVYQGAQVTTGASQYIECLIGCRFPNDVLKF